MVNRFEGSVHWCERATTSQGGTLHRGEEGKGQPKLMASEIPRRYGALGSGSFAGPGQ